MERVFWLLSGKDGALVKKMMEQFQDTHTLSIPETLHKKVCGVVLLLFFLLYFFLYFLNDVKTSSKRHLDIFCTLFWPEDSRS